MEYKTYTSDELAVIIAKHKLWLNDEDGGDRADLSSADLSSANLRSADLRFADLSSAAGELTHIKSIFVETYPIVYTSEHLQIGCEKHLISEWREFDDKRILKMDGDKALNFWSNFKYFIFMSIELSPALATGFVEKEAEAA